MRLSVLAAARPSSYSLIRFKARASAPAFNAITCRAEEPVQNRCDRQKVFHGLISVSAIAMASLGIRAPKRPLPPDRAARILTTSPLWRLPETHRRAGEAEPVLRISVCVSPGALIGSTWAVPQSSLQHRTNNRLNPRGTSPASSAQSELLLSSP